MKNESYKMIKDKIYGFDTHADGNVLHNKKKGRLPAMGWNSWNAFGSGNNEKLTLEMADAFLKLGLKDLGYQYIVLDDGCYKPERVDGRLSNDEVKFPSGFKALADTIHEKGLLFGMYNDIGTNLCAGAAVGTYGHEKEDAASYLEWGIDFLKVDNCYNIWDNATFSDEKNARYSFAPNIKAVKISGCGYEKEYEAVIDGILWGNLIEKKDHYVTKIGTCDGTGPERTPVGIQSGELHMVLEVPEDGEYSLTVTYASGEEEGVGSYLQMKLDDQTERCLYDDLVPLTENTVSFTDLKPLKVALKKGKNRLRIMNHRRQENTLSSYGTLLMELNTQDPENDLVLSLCEWGKTQPQNWGYKVGDSWRILNDITFQVGADGDPGQGCWAGDYTNNLAAQYNKAVIMDEFSGLSKGWNDPDMMMIGMNGLDETQNKTHMVMWCMMNAPLMLGLDLRRVEVGDTIHEIITNKDLIALNQDPLGIQAKRIACIGKDGRIDAPDKTYVRDNARVDILAKPLCDGSIAISVINVSEQKMEGDFSVKMKDVAKALKGKMLQPDAFEKADFFAGKDLWGKECFLIMDGILHIGELQPCENVTVKVTPHV